MDVIEKKGVGVNHNENVHFLDHLGVICTLMDIPLLVIDEVNEALAKRYYPELKVIKLSYDELTAEYLFANYDVLFLSEYWDIDSYSKQCRHLEEKFHKQIRIVHCPHGFSDKAYYLDKCVHEDIVLAYGQRMLDLLSIEQIKRPVMTGNYRYTYYQKHRQFYINILKEEVLNQFEKQQPIILYAPTWQDSFLSSTFFEACAPLIDQLPPSYNLIVKLHPSLERHNIAEYYTILNTYKQKKNVLFLCEFPPIYPLLDCTDLYIGDTSSIGYDFLIFDKPMFFLNKFYEDPKTTERIYLYRCGTNITPENYSHLYSIIAEQLPHDQARYSHIRKEVYEYAFAQQREFAEIKQDIITSYSTPRE